MKIIKIMNQSYHAQVVMVTIIVLAALVLSAVKLFSHVVDVHIPTSEDFKLEEERHNESQKSDSLKIELDDGRTIEIRDDDTVNCYDRSGKCTGKIS